METFEVDNSGAEKKEVRIGRGMYCEMLRDGKRMFAFDRDMICLSDVFAALVVNTSDIRLIKTWLKKKDMEILTLSPEQTGENSSMICITIEQFVELCQKYKKDWKGLISDKIPNVEHSTKSAKTCERDWVKPQFMNVNFKSTSTLTF